MIGPVHLRGTGTTLASLLRRLSATLEAAMGERHPEAWIPNRIFLDSNCLQALHDYGGTIFEHEEAQPVGRSGAAVDDVRALEGLFVFVDRGAFEFMLSSGSLVEVSASSDPAFRRWGYDVLDHSDACLGPRDALSGEGVARARLVDGTAFSYLSAADRRLIREAVELECDTFLTIERRLPRNQDHLWKWLRLLVLRPPQLWAYLRPHLSGL